MGIMSAGPAKWFLINARSALTLLQITIYALPAFITTFVRLAVRAK